MKKIKIILVTLVSMVMACGGLGSAIWADDTKSDETNYILGITPTQKGFETMEPGKSYTESFKVRNKGNGSFNYKVELAPYSIKNEQYDPNYDEETQYTDIVGWITLNKTEGSVAHGEEEVITYTIDVPKDAHGGAQMATILVSMGGEGEDGLQMVQRLGYLIYGNVDGDVVKTAQILTNEVPGFVFDPPITATSLVENTGNVYTIATYTLQVFPLFGDEEVYTNEESPDTEIVFPETKKLYAQSWEGAPKLGVFRVRQTIRIFGEESAVEKLVFLCPLWFLFTVLLIVFVAIVWIVGRMRDRRKRSRE